MIVINARFLTQKVTGVQRFAIEICKRLPEAIGDKKIVFVAPKTELVLSNLELNSEIIQIGRFNGQIWEQIDLPIFLKKNENPLLINFIGIGPVFYKRKIMFLYDLAFKHHPEWFSYSFHKVYNLLIPISLKNTLLVLTDSHYVKEDISNSYKIKKEKIYVIYAAASNNFVNLNLDKENYILTVSSIDPRKNLKRVIQAFIALDIEYKLVIVGSKNKTFANSNIPFELLSENVIFTGYLADHELVELYNKSEIFIYASLFEGFGIPPLEAQACGCSCLVSNTTSLPEVYGDSVEYCNPFSIEDIKNQMESLLRNPSRRAFLKNKGFENVKKYKWESSVNKFIEIVKSIE